MKVFEKLQRTFNKKAKSSKQQQKKKMKTHSHFEFTSLPTDVKHRVAGFLCAKDTAHLMQASKSMAADLNLAIASFTLMDTNFENQATLRKNAQRCFAVIFPKTSDLAHSILSRYIKFRQKYMQCFAVILPNKNAELVHSMTFGWTQTKSRRNEDHWIFIIEQEQPAPPSPDDLYAMIQIPWTSGKEVASSMESQGAGHVALSFYPKPNKIYQLFCCCNRMDITSPPWRIDNPTLHWVGLRTDALEYSACRHRVRLHDIQEVVIIR